MKKRLTWAGGKYLKWFAVVVVGLIVVSKFIIPTPVFNKPIAKVLLSKEKFLLAAHIATDGQWRFGAVDSIPYKFSTCILHFEDEYFFSHPGINPVSIAKAIKSNLSQQKKVCGGSTITMQVARMIGEQGERTYFKKVGEMLLALHLEINLSKSDILNLYVSNAPFGGNVVGLNAAAWRYYGKLPSELSWAENALLAVLPNAPSLLYPGKGIDELRKKRNRLLLKLKEKQIISDETYRLSILESIPDRPLKLPNNAQHALFYGIEQTKQDIVKSTLNAQLQNSAQEILNRHVNELKWNEVYNAAAIIVEVSTGNIVAYVGNVNQSIEHANKVDVVTANRSTGSVLKPFLYALSLQKGIIVPQQLLPDIPTYYAGYSPKNYFLTFDGAVKADEALYRSLNVPFVRFLKDYGINEFHKGLQQLGLSSLKYAPSHYGLSLILGGAEASLLELTGIYASMGRVLNRYNQIQTYNELDYFTPTLIKNEIGFKKTDYPRLSAGSIYSTFEALTQVNRPLSENGWKSFYSTNKIAWKTGTSFGNKDAWAIGVTPKYAVGVWVGNADGEGRNGLTGVSVAGPVMFDLYELLNQTDWFQTPTSEMENALICKQSGFRAGTYCEKVDTLPIPKANNKELLCKYHRLVHLTPNQQYQITANCTNEGIVHKSWFILPPIQEWYYKSKSPLYKTLPPFHPSCNQTEQNPMVFSYPVNTNKLFIPKELNGKKGRIVFEIVHRIPNKNVHWHLDENYLGSTQDLHNMEVLCDKGPHVLLVVDEDGNELKKWFEVLD